MAIYKIKPWEELTIRDDYMFKLVMRRKRICKKMLERILKVEIASIRYIEDEKSMKPGYLSKGIRLDVYVKDGKGTVYDIEMQVREMPYEALGKRTRYYQSMIDADLLAIGADYDELNHTIIIFICPFPLFGSNRHIFTFRSLCAEDPSIVLPDGSTKIFLSTKGTADDVDEKVKAFLDYVDGIHSDDAFVKEIDEEINEIKKMEKERMSYMTLEMKIKDERKEALREGMKRGQEETTRHSIRMLMKNTGATAEKAMEMLGIDRAQWAKYTATLL